MIISTRIFKDGEKYGNFKFSINNINYTGFLSNPIVLVNYNQAEIFGKVLRIYRKDDELWADIESDYFEFGLGGRGDADNNGIINKFDLLAVSLLKKEIK